MKKLLFLILLSIGLLGCIPNQYRANNIPLGTHYSLDITSADPTQIGVTAVLDDTAVHYTLSNGLAGCCVTSVSGASPIVSSGGLTPSISCTTCVTSVGGTSPIVSSGGVTPGISCTTCVTSVSGTSPIVSSGGVTPSISCTTCVTSVGGTSPIVSSGGVTPGISCATCGITGSPLSQFASTTSSQLAGAISDETGAGSLVFANSPTFNGNIGFGAAPTSSLEWYFRDDQNGAVQIIVDNVNASPSSLAIVGMLSSDGASAGFISSGPSYTTSGALKADSAIIVADTGKSGGLILSADAAAPIEMWTNGVQRVVVSSAGTMTIPNIKSTTGNRYVCVDTNGTLVSQSAVCVGT